MTKAVERRLTDGGVYWETVVVDEDGGGGGFEIVAVEAATASGTVVDAEAEILLDIEAAAPGAAGNGRLVLFVEDAEASEVTAAETNPNEVTFTYPPGDTACGDIVTAAEETPAVAALIVVTAPAPAAVFAPDPAPAPDNPGFVFLSGGADEDTYLRTSLRVEITNDEGLIVFDSNGSAELIVNSRAVIVDDTDGGDVIVVSRTPGEGAEFFGPAEEHVASINENGINVGSQYDSPPSPLLVVIDQAVDPQADGVTAPPGSIGLQAGTMWLKAGELDTEWLRLLTENDLP